MDDKLLTLCFLLLIAGGTGFLMGYNAAIGDLAVEKYANEVADYAMDKHASKRK